jgi:hypothetical protein
MSFTACLFLSLLHPASDLDFFFSPRCKPSLTHYHEIRYIRGKNAICTIRIPFNSIHAQFISFKPRKKLLLVLFFPAIISTFFYIASVILYCLLFFSYVPGQLFLFTLWNVIHIVNNLIYSKVHLFKFWRPRLCSRSSLYFDYFFLFTHITFPSTIVH